MLPIGLSIMSKAQQKTHEWRVQMASEIEMNCNARIVRVMAVVFADWRALRLVGMFHGRGLCWSLVETHTSAIGSKLK